MKLAAKTTTTILLLTLTATAAVAQHDHSMPSERLGKVQFVTSCDAAVRDAFNQAVAVLHSFGYAKAGAAFTAIAEKDPACAMAYWGMAMSHYHPLWEAPGRSDLQQGSQAIEEARAAAKTQRERDYISALSNFYADWETTDHRKRALAYETAMEKLQAQYPDDREAKIFYALAVRGNAPPEDKTYAKQKQAGAILEPIFAEQPEHPGLAHYLIHCYDYPALAGRALSAARSYAKIAPDSPHALHMPSHIFTRLGLWQEDIQSNIASATAARNQKLFGDELHARDYIVYAYLQKGQDRAAQQTMKDIPASGPDPADAANFAALYALGAMPARYSLERHQWAEAANLEIPALPKTGRYAWAIANIYFARALGSAHIGRTESTQADLQQLRSLQDSLGQAGETFWAGQVGIQAEIASAWLTAAQGKKEDAIVQMRAAADHEDATDKHPVTPGVVVPARELLGEMLLETHRAPEALAAYESVLSGAPNRFNALAGAARAASVAGQTAKAREFSTRLLQLASEADGERPELQSARTLLAKASP